jgi:hypothetical protein
MHERCLLTLWWTLVLINKHWALSSIKSNKLTVIPYYLFTIMLANLKIIRVYCGVFKMMTIFNFLWHEWMENDIPSCNYDIIKLFVFNFFTSVFHASINWIKPYIFWLLTSMDAMGVIVNVIIYDLLHLKHSLWKVFSCLILDNYLLFLFSLMIFWGRVLPATFLEQLNKSVIEFCLHCSCSSHWLLHQNTLELWILVYKPVITNQLNKILAIG